MDRRDMIRALGHWWERLDENRMVAIVDDDGNEIEISIEFEICSTCNGKGKHVNPSIDAHGITGDEWNEWSPEEQEHYLAGGFDVDCYECSGRRVIPVPVNLSAEQRKIMSTIFERQNEYLAEYRMQMLECGLMV